VTGEGAATSAQEADAVTDIQPTAYEPHPLHTLISWPAVLAGAIVAVAVGAMLNLLGVAIGAAALNPFDMSGGDARAFSVGAGVWVALANAVALFAGAFVASRSAKFTDHHRGLLHGLSVWAVAFLIALLIAGSTAGGGLTAVFSGAAETADVDADVPAPPAPPVYYERGGPMVLIDPSNPPPGVAPAARPATDRTAAVTGPIALWAFLTMLLGAVGAIAGARYGSRRHGWEARMKMTDNPAVHAPSGGPT